MSNPTVNPKPLEKVLREIKRAEREIADAKEQQISVGKEVNDLLSSVSPGDVEGARMLGLKKTHLDIIPHFLERRERELGELLEKLNAENLRVMNELCEAGCEERILLGKNLDARQGPFFPDGLGNLAAYSPIIARIPMNYGMLGVDHIPCSTTGAAILKADALLGIYGRWAANGSRYTEPEAWKAVFAK